MKPATCLLDRYSLRQELSHKAGRRTFLARDSHAQDSHAQEPVVVKVIQFGQAFQWNDLKLFEREAKILKSLDHPAIPKYKDYFEADIDGVQSFVLVQTYIDAISLEAAIQQGRSFSEAEVIEIAERLLTILSYLHENMPSVVHRDIKPSNILIANRSGNSIGNVYLVDFGSVQTVASKESGTITIVGSYGYIPLEQFAGQAVPASDLYSLGMTLIYLATGVHPADLPQVKGKVQLGGDRISPQFTEWLARMTRPYVSDRFGSARLALAALEIKDGSEGYFQHLKPANSRVDVYRDRNRLEITIKIRPEVLPVPAACLIFGSVVVISISVFFNLMFFVSLGLTGGLMLGAVLLISILALATLNFSIVWISRKCKTFLCEVLSIDRSSGIRMGTRYGESKAVRWQVGASRFRDIDLLAYYPGHIFHQYYEKGCETKQSGTVKVSSKLSIHAGSVEYPITITHLSHGEFLWIKKELSDFIDLEIQTIGANAKPKDLKNV